MPKGELPMDVLLPKGMDTLPMDMDVLPMDMDVLPMDIAGLARGVDAMLPKSAMMESLDILLPALLSAAAAEPLDCEKRPSGSALLLLLLASEGAEEGKPLPEEVCEPRPMERRRVLDN